MSTHITFPASDTKVRTLLAVEGVPAWAREDALAEVLGAERYQEDVENITAVEMVKIIDHINTVWPKGVDSAGITYED